MTPSPVSPRLWVAKAMRRLAVMVDPEVRAPSRTPRTCPICGFHGPFLPSGGNSAPRPDGICRGCGSAERHRLLKLVLDREGVEGLGRVLHFAPEAAVARFVRPLAESYVSADLAPGAADRVADIEALDLPDDAVDTVICSHVLEHVDDRKALGEIARVLVPGGLAILAVPIAEGWPETYEDPAVTGWKDRIVHYGQGDHVRYYGRDFRDRVRAAGFDLREVGVGGAETVAHGLVPGEVVFLATRTAAAS